MELLSRSDTQKICLNVIYNGRNKGCCLGYLCSLCSLDRNHFGSLCMLPQKHIYTYLFSRFQFIYNNKCVCWHLSLWSLYTQLLKDCQVFFCNPTMSSKYTFNYKMTEKNIAIFPQRGVWKIPSFFDSFPHSHIIRYNTD